MHRGDRAVWGRAGELGADGVQNAKPESVALSQTRGVFRFGRCWRQHIAWVMLRAWLWCPAHPRGMGQGALLLQVCGAADNRARCPRALSESRSACNILLELISLTRRLEWLKIAAAGN